MTESSNQIAKSHWSELQQLDETLSLLPHGQDQRLTSHTLTLEGPSTQLLSPATSSGPVSVDQTYSQVPPPNFETGFDPANDVIPMLSSAEIMEMADSIGICDAEWISSAMTDHDIW